jgi:hypothetical protein
MGTVLLWLGVLLGCRFKGGWVVRSLSLYAEAAAAAKTESAAHDRRQGR